MHAPQFRLRASPRFRLRVSIAVFWGRGDGPAAACVVVCRCACLIAVLTHRSHLLGAYAGFRASSTLRLSLIHPFAPTPSQVASTCVERPVLVLLTCLHLRHFKHCIVRFAPIIATLLQANLHAFLSPRFRSRTLPQFRLRTCRTSEQDRIQQRRASYLRRCLHLAAACGTEEARACVVVQLCRIDVVRTFAAALRQLDAGYGIPAEGAAPLVQIRS